jgi:hypothetical protein
MNSTSPKAAARVAVPAKRDSGALRQAGRANDCLAALLCGDDAQRGVLEEPFSGTQRHFDGPRGLGLRQVSAYQLGEPRSLFGSVGGVTQGVHNLRDSRAQSRIASNGSTRGIHGANVRDVRDVRIAHVNGRR